MHTNQRAPKVTHPALMSDDDDNIFGSAEDYDDADLSPNIYLKPTKTSSDGGGGAGSGTFTANQNNHHHFPYKPLFGNTGIGSNSAGGNVGSGINGNSINGNNGIVTRTEVRSYDNEVSTATASANMITTVFGGGGGGRHRRHNGKYTNDLYSVISSNNFILFTFNLLISIFVRLFAT